MARRDFQALERRRMRAVGLFEQGETQSTVAHRLGVSRTTAMRWATSWKSEGLDGLRGAGRAGRKPRLTEDELVDVEGALLEGPIAAGYSTEFWTLPRVAEVIESITGVRYHPGHVWRVLRKMGWSRQKPTTRARERDETAIERWIKTTWPAQKKPARLGATIVFIDESGFSERPSVQRTWTPRGQTPVLRHRFSHWKHLSAIGALAYSPHGRRARFFLSLVPGAVRSEQIIRFLQRLHQHHPGPLIVIWDGVNPHRSVATRAFAERERHWLTLVRLPSYAPELNPVEGAWSWFERTVGNFCPEGHGPLHKTLRLARRRLTSKHPLLLGFLHKSGLYLP